MTNKTMKLENYLTFVCLSDGSSISFSNNVEYCIGNSIWNTLYYGTKIENIMKGTTVSFRLNNPIIDTIYGVGVFSTEGSFDLIGNIMSMLFYDEAIGHIDLTGFEKAFCNMFQNNNSLVDCSKLNLPATTLADDCYSRMFYGCTNLVKAPNLPATTLADACYYQMFEDCTSLTKAPELPATTLADDCYAYMFRNCTNLNYIKMLATGISALYCLNDWVSGVASTGTFVKSKDATWDVVGDSGVPTGWTVITDDQLVNGKVVNPISVRYGNYSSYIKQYPVYVDSVYPVSSDLYVGFDVGNADGELVYTTRQILIGETSQAPAYTKTTPVTNIVYGPKEDACFIYDFPEANENVTLSIFDILLGETENGGFYERGMTWREYCGSRYNVLGFIISGDYVYNNASLVEDANGNLVSPDDLIVENGGYYTVE